MSDLTNKLIEAQKYAMSIRPQIGGFPVLAEVLRQAGVQLPFHSAAGGHTWHYWQALMPQIMPTLARQLQPAPLP